MSATAAEWQTLLEKRDTPLSHDELAAIGAADVAERRGVVAKLSRADLARVMEKIDSLELIATGRLAAAKLGTYSETINKEERVRGERHGAQLLSALVREAPRAVKLEVVAGPAKGRRVLYDASVKTDKLLGKEPGLLGLVGAQWVDINGVFARRDTNHPITDLAFSAILDLLEHCFKQLTPFGGYVRKDEGFDGSGRYVITFSAPPSAKGIYARKARIGIDVGLLLPTLLEIDDDQGMLERFEFNDVAVAPGADFATSKL